MDVHITVKKSPRLFSVPPSPMTLHHHPLLCYYAIAGYLRGLKTLGLFILGVGAMTTVFCTVLESGPKFVFVLPLLFCPIVLYE